MSHTKVFSERTTMWSVLLGIFVALVGFLLLSVAATWQWIIDHPGTQLVVRQLGSLLIASVAVAFLWTLVGRRAFLDEILNKVRLSDDVRKAGLTAVNMDYERSIDWSRLFRSVSKMDLFVAYAQTWRRNHRDELESLATRGDCRVRIVLPNPENPQLMTELARRFNTETADVERKIREAQVEFTDIFANKKDITFEFYFADCSPVYSYYRFNLNAIVTLYNHQSGKTPVAVPAFGVEEGLLYDFLRKEFDEILQKKVRQIFPAK